MQSDAGTEKGDAEVSGASLDGNHPPMVVGEDGTCAYCGQRLERATPGQPEHHLPSPEQIPQADAWVANHGDQGFAIDDLHAAYLSLGGDRGAPVTVLQIAEFLVPDLIEYCAALDSQGIEAIDWITPTVATLIQFQRRWGKLKATGEGAETVIQSWDAPES
jgi:hypothetical protein